MRLARSILSVVALALGGVALAGSSVVTSKHNLSVSGPGPIRAATETQVCVFCHVSHGEEPLGQNRPTRMTLYAPYESSTLHARPSSSPSGASRLCLSCHDGTIALGETVASGTIAMVGTDPSGRLPEGLSKLGTDLRRTHPVSFMPLPSPTHRTLEGSGAVKLDRAGMMQCTACHDPHREDLDPIRRKFLVQPNRFSELCVTCHALPYWQSNPSAHQSSTALVTPARASGYAYATVAENACESCHRPHNGSERGRLLRAGSADPDERVCLDCHDGRTARADIVKELAKPSAHVASAPGERAHDAAEGPDNTRFELPERSSGAPRHVTCADCHNPHAAFRRKASAPGVPGALAGVWGIDARGEKVDPAAYEYEVCFKCHADSANQAPGLGLPRPGAPRRAQPEANLRLQFAADAASAHPVVHPARAPDVPSLKPPLTPASLVYCTDCHSSDSGPGAGGPGAAGPHGSVYAFLLERNLSTADFTPESPLSYALCYKCHDRGVLLSDASAFPSHRKHVVDSATPCTACHTAHGVASLQGNPVNHAHLVDFDVNIVQPASRGLRQYVSAGPRAGTCFTSCHGVEHDGTPY